jgi:hypothetical protein
MTRTIKLIALALTAAAVAAPLAQGVEDPSGKQAVDPLAVSYLQNQGYSPGQIKVLIGRGDPLAFSYLLDQGFTVAQIKAQATVRTPPREITAIDPLAVSYLRNLGMSQAQIDDWTTGVCAQKDRPAVCSLPVSAVSAPETPSASSGFGWSDAGIGAGATLGLVLLLAGVGGAFAISRQNRRRTVANA